MTPTREVLIRDAEMRVVSRSHNLRGILTYTRLHRVERVDIYLANDGSAQLGLCWADGATCITDFASAAVLRDWCKSRRAFPPATEHRLDT